MTAPEDAQPTPVLIVIGTRPEAIKMLPLVLEFQKHPRLRPIVVSTGQHAELVRRVLDVVGITPDVELNATRPRMSLNGLFSSIMTGLENYVSTKFGDPPVSSSLMSPSGYPVVCFVHGDTTSAAASALAAFHLRIPVAHVEAGLRTSDILSPFPEELNRQLISRIAAFHLAPTQDNKDALIREGVNRSRIFVTGNTAIDTLQIAVQMNRPYGVPQLEDLETDNESRVVVVTAHRRENWGEPLHRIARAVAILAERYPNDRFVVPMHPNPDVSLVWREHLSSLANVSLIAPLDYLPFARLLARAHFALSDSGGVQEEAPALGTPVLVLRESTERQEAVNAGTVEMVGTNTERIVEAATALFDDPLRHREFTMQANPYGDGHAAERIAQAFSYIAYAGEEPKQYGPIFDRDAVRRAAGYAEHPTANMPVGQVLTDLSSG